ncbi:MAG: ABC transporter substrate-binding protein [Thermogemmatispora sp.]|jgi:peptide/nickel transport system substrate-binding protein|uniref:ABC transporter substrate-binding protein n=1 Tax=Thermogemmatispora TaxID=768669 RepID=UPI00124CA9FB|nr:MULTISPECIES: ABC transporter substrate-binding protein [Thermogemmatispora]MBE3567941.1 ABC transporter substrate-binding protein [Thermogemmatispora sp.]GER85504.1 peptide ABC transporter substrate-binding protein [Thermogemmatispora aurantia]
MCDKTGLTRSSPRPGSAAGLGRTVLSLLALSLLLLLAACGQGSSSSSSNKTHVLTVVPSPKGDFTNGFSPYSATANYGSQGMIYETLLFFNRMNSQITPWLAQSYDFSSDAKTLTFHLRSGVKWSDGQPFTSADVVFTLQMLKQYPAADTNGLWQYIQSVQASDDQTVTVTLKAPYTPILWYLAGQTWIVSKHEYASAGDPTKFVDANPVGTGPFMLKSFSPQLITLKKNPNYWQPGKPAVDEIRYPAFDSNTSAELLLSRGDVDWTGLYTPNIQQTYVAKDPAHNHYWFPNRNIVMLYLNTAKAPFNQLAVRQAISAAIDREQIYKVAESGYEPVASPTGLVLPENQSFLNPKYANVSFAKDPNQSQQLLESAGFHKGSDGIYVDSSGKKLSFQIDVVTGWTDWVTAVQIIASDLKAIGIDAKVNSISFNAYFSALQMGSYDMAISWTNPGPTPFYLYNSLLNSSNSAPLGKPAASNWERWMDPTTDKLLAQYATTTDQAQQQQALYGLQQIMVEQLPSIPLVYGATWYEYSSRNFTGWPDAQNAYASPAPFDFPDAEVVALNLKPVA